jgi:dTDP-4-dehydrorhamnose reductase
MKWLLLGANGQLGQSMQVTLDEMKIEYVAVGRDQVDITSNNDVTEAITSIAPQIVVNLAAWTNVDGAESHEAESFKVNAYGAQIIAKACSIANKKLIHISTDYVFDGQSETPYDEDCARHPLNKYGESKALGEHLVLSEHPNGVWIVRTAWLYSQFGNNFAKAILRKARSNEDLSVVNDSWGQPTSALDLSRQLVKLGHSQAPPGIFHGTNSGRATWFDFAAELVRDIGFAGALNPVASEPKIGVAPRPKYSVLGHEKWSVHHITPMRDWKVALEEIRPLILENL